MAKQDGEKEGERYAIQRAQNNRLSCCPVQSSPAQSCSSFLFPSFVSVSFLFFSSLLFSFLLLRLLLLLHSPNPNPNPKPFWPLVHLSSQANSLIPPQPIHSFTLHPSTTSTFPTQNCPPCLRNKANPLSTQKSTPPSCPMVVKYVHHNCQTAGPVSIGISRLDDSKKTRVRKNDTNSTLFFIFNALVEILPGNKDSDHKDLHPPGSGSRRNPLAPWRTTCLVQHC